MRDEKLLKELTQLWGVSGYEKEVRKYIEKEAAPYADEMLTDAMGNLIVKKNGTGGPDSKKIMYAAHMDEIGFMVKTIEADGRLRVCNLGWNWTGSAYNSRVQFKNGTIGVVSCMGSIEEAANKAGKLYIDIGATSKEDALKYVNLGDPIVRDTHIRKLANGKFTARALDDRLGVYIIMEAMKRAKERGCKAGVYGASTTGEETTKTGAYWTSTRINPTMAIVVDVTYASDYNGMDPAETGTVLLGEGPVLCNSPIVVKALNAKMEECAKEAGIPVQREAASRLTYTDGDKIHFSNQGVPMVLVSIPLRYMHMPAEVADEKDVEGCIELIAEFLVKCV